MKVTFKKDSLVKSKSITLTWKLQRNNTIKSIDILELMKQMVINHSINKEKNKKRGE